MICIIGGGREWEMTSQARDWLDWLGLKLPITRVLSGHYGKADLAGEAWAKARGIPIVLFEPQWGALGRPAGPIRNGEMVAAAQCAIVFPGNKGTADLLSQAGEKKPMPLKILEYAPKPRVQAVLL